jgi:hypothetical protein
MDAFVEHVIINPLYWYRDLNENMSGIFIFFCLYFSPNFQDNLKNRVTCLDELISYHNKYLNRVLFRYINAYCSTPFHLLIYGYLDLNFFTITLMYIVFSSGVY